MGSSGGGAQNTAANLTKGLAGQDLGKTQYPQWQQYVTDTNNLVNGASGQNAVAGANTAAAMGGNVAQNVGNFSNSLIPYAKNILDLGFDPQQALYDRTLHQVQEQQRVGQAARGIEMTPYGAGLENDALQNFNIDWQNNALDRAVTAGNTASSIGSNALTLGSGASGLAASSAYLPYSTQRGLLNDKAAALNAESTGVANSNVPRQQAIGNNAQIAQQNIQSSSANQSAIMGLVPALIGK